MLLDARPIHTDRLRGVPETLLIPLRARAIESAKPHGLFVDPVAASIIQHLDRDLSEFARDWMSQVGISVRTRILDDEAAAFFAANPGATVVNLGAGLCTRFDRLGLPDVTWIDLDLPEVVQLRREVGQRLGVLTQRRTIGASILDREWMDAVPWSQGSPLLFIAEGVLPYFSRDQVRHLLVTLSDRFPGAHMLLEAVSPLLVRLGARHPSVGKTSARFQWGVTSARSIHAWSPRITVLREWRYFGRGPGSWRWIRGAACIPQVSRILQLAHLRFEPNG